MTADRLNLIWIIQAQGRTRIMQAASLAVLEQVLNIAGTRSELETRVHQIKAILTHQSLQAIYSGATLRLTLLCRFLAWPVLPGFRITGSLIEDRGAAH
jgi:hypothetical protein